jgi:hypothetical protein
MFESDHGRELPLKINAVTREVNKIPRKGSRRWRYYCRSRCSIRRGVNRSQQAFVTEAKVAVMADDDVVKHADAQHLADLL